MSTRRSPNNLQGPQGPRTMGSLRTRRPPPNLNLIVANPDSDEDSASSMDEKAASQLIKQSEAKSLVPQSTGVTITAQPPTPAISGLPQQGHPTSGMRKGDGSGPFDQGRNTEGASIISTSPPIRNQLPMAQGGSTGGSSGTVGNALPLNPPSNQASSPASSVVPGMMTASNLRFAKPTSLNTTGLPISSMMQSGNGERTLPKLHTPPAYPIPPPPASAGLPAPGRPNVSITTGFGMGNGYQQPGGSSFLNKSANNTATTGVASSPIHSSSPSSPSMSYSQLTHKNSIGSNSGTAEGYRRRHEGLPMLPPRPKQVSGMSQVIAGSNSGSHNNGMINPSHALPPIPSATSGSSMVSVASSAPSPQRLGSVRLAVTVDNENFSVVDVSGMGSSEAIMERVFAKLRFRDDDHPSLELYRTDIGEAPEQESVGRSELFELCKKQGDAKGTLKFLIMQTSMAPSPSSAAIPPPTGHGLIHGLPLPGLPITNTGYTLGSPAELSRKTFSVSSASGAGDRMIRATGGGGSRHSKSGSVSSASEKFGGRGDFGYETSPVDSYPNTTPGLSSQAAQSTASASGSVGGAHSLNRHHALISRSSRRMPSTSTSRGSQSPAEEKSRPGGSRMYGSPPPPFERSHTPPGAASGSNAIRLDYNHSTLKRGQTTPLGPFPNDKCDSRMVSASTILANHRPSLPNTYPYMHDRPQVESPGKEVDPASSYDAVEWEPSPSEPTEADMALIYRMQQEEDDRERRKLVQMREDERVAMQEQQKEQAAWEAMQAREQEARQRQVEADRVAAERAVERERRVAEQDRERIERHQREAEVLEKEREKRVGQERKARRAQWENKIGMWNSGMPYLGNEESSETATQTSPVDGRYEYTFGSLSAGSSRQAPTPTARDPYRTPSQAARDDPNDPFGAYDGLQAVLPPGATYGYQVEPAIRDRREQIYHTQSGPVPQAGSSLRSNRSIANIHRSATTQPGPDPISYYDTRSLGPRHAISHPPLEQDPSYRNDLARIRSADTTRLYNPQRAPIPELAFPEPHPSPVVRMDRRGSESAAQLANQMSAIHSRRASFAQAPPYWQSDQTEGYEVPDQAHLVTNPPLSTPRTNPEEPSSRGSESTVRLDEFDVEHEEDDSGNTARAHEWSGHLQGMLEGGEEGTLVPSRSSLSNVPDDLEDEAEETLFFVSPEQGSNGVATKPSLKLDTEGARPSLAQMNTSNSTSSSEFPTAGTVESDFTQESGGSGLRRAKSFAKTKDQWNFRPPAEDVYDRLEEFFPKIDLDKPVVDGTVVDPIQEAATAQAEATIMPAPKSSRQPGFNKADARKSIRFVAEGRKKHLSKIAPAVKQQGTSLERKRSSSMWGHKLVEVTPAGIQQGKVPNIVPGETAPDGTPVTMTWVKGDLIGKGTYGRVYLALNATTGDMIAVKQVEMPASDSEREDARQTGMIEALKSEIALLKDLDHAHVVAYLGWEESPEYLSIFLEYVPGGSVASVYRKHKKFEEEVIKSFTMQILDGLAYLHSLNILHRDLKADNILVDHTGTCKISDFGISKRTDDAYDSIISTNLKGSVFWMAPEVVHSVKGQGYSAKVDIWSLGCVVLEMWAGRRPWGDMEALAAMFQLANTRAAPPVPDDVTLSAVADDFLNKKCFASSPRDRPVAEELLRHPFITDRDPNYSFMESKIGKAVAAGTKRRRIEPSQA